jgi:hypothetical protein
VRDGAPDHSPRRVEQRVIGPDPDDSRLERARRLRRRTGRNWHLHETGRATATDSSHGDSLRAPASGITRRTRPPLSGPPQP